MSKNFQQLVDEYEETGNKLKNQLATEITAKMRHAIQQGYDLDQLDFEQAESDDEAEKGVDFRKLFGNDHSFHVNDDERNDCIIGVWWDEQSGVAKIAHQSEEDELMFANLTDEQLTPSDLCETLRLLTEWMNKGL